VKITRIETVHSDLCPSVLFVRIHTDEGLIGTADTFYTPETIRSFVHEFAAPMLLGKDPGRIERHWFDLYDRQVARFGGLGAEMRAISAIDVALWDLAGQAAALPIYRLLGGRFRDDVRIYNTCGGPQYGRPPYARGGNGPGPLEDLHAAINRPAELAQELIAEGITGMKIWPFDPYGLRNDGRFITPDELRAGLEPVRRIREAVGDKIDIMIEGHGYWDLPTAKKIAHALEEYEPAWIEDMLLGHDIGAIRELKDSTGIPVLASEFLMTRHQYRPLLEQGAADIVMIDPTWAGGITESRKISTMADAYGLPVAMHDCTGPFTLLAGVHLAVSAPNTVYQETVRAYIRTWYRDLIPDVINISDGRITPPDGPGIGAALLPSVFEQADTTVVASDE
jgi:L-alanine-DL-glutamate epimerase-like enolase superfamily enzyme